MHAWLGVGMQGYVRDLLSIPSLAELSPEVHVFCKSGDPRMHAELQSMSVGAPVTVVPVGNVGKEGAAYLEYIARQYDGLPEYVLFTQVRAA